MMTRNLIALVVAVVASAVVLSARQLPSQPMALPDAPADIQTLVRQAIEDRMAARDIPDLDFRRHSPTLVIRREMSRTKMMLGPDAMPQVNGYTFLLRTNAELQSEADQTHTSIMFIIVNGAVITGNTAFVDLGTDLVHPSDPKVITLCCCVGHGGFNRMESRWVFERWLGMVCR